MQLWRILLFTINLVLGPARSRLLLGVFLAGLGYVLFLPASRAVAKFSSLKR